MRSSWLLLVGRVCALRLLPLAAVALARGVRLSSRSRCVSRAEPGRGSRRSERRLLHRPYPWCIYGT